MSREDVGNSEDGHCHPPHPLGKACAAGPRPFPTVGAVALYLAIATVDLLHSVRHQNRPFLLTLQFLQLGVPLQPNVITMVWNRDTEYIREACSETKSQVTSLSAMLPLLPYLVSVIH